MSIKSKKRIYISVSPEVEDALSLIAEEKRLPIATVASHLLEQAIELEEDRIWSEIAEKRIKENTKWHTHEEAWN